MGFGKLLEQKMKMRNVKQAELADAIGIPKTTLSSIISRDNSKIEIEVLLDICEYLKCSPEEFYEEYRKDKINKYQIADNPKCELYEKCYATDIKEVVKLAVQLDTLDLGRVIGTMEEMLRADKYRKKENVM